MTSSACALAEARNSSTTLSGCCRTRAPKRPTRHVFDGIHPSAGGFYDRMLAVRNALDRHGPTPLQHVHGSSHGRDCSKPKRKECKCREQFPHKVDLQRDHCSQEPPHPFPVFVLGLHLSSIPHPHFTQHLPAQWVALTPKFRHLLRCATLARRSSFP
jgi:hypothetical protein